jgi:hypothetical protein
VSLRPREAPRDERADSARAGAPSRLVARARPRPPAPLPPRRVADGERAATAGELAARRAQLLRFAVTLPDVAIGESRLEPHAAGLFVRLPRDGGAGVESREFATLRTRPQWRLSVLLPARATAELQRLGWGRPRHADGSGPLVLELVRPRHDDDLGPLQRVIAAAHRDAQGRNR